MLEKVLLSMATFLFGVGMCCAKSHKLKIVTFNIGGDFIAEGYNQWKNRKPLMMQFLSNETPDILCLQEVLINQLTDIEMRFPMYDMVGVSRVDGKAKGDFVPIFYRKDKFEQINSGTFCLSEKPDSIGFIGWDAKYPRIATWINLKFVDTGEIVFVINAHLDNIGKIARVNSMKLILDKISLLSKSKRIILSGDLNDLASSKVHNMASQRGLNDTYLIASKIKGVNYSIHQFGQRDVEKRRKLDYVFASDDFKIISVNIPKEKPKKSVYISDHNPVAVKMRF